MKRRDFVKNTALSLSALALMQQGLIACKKNSNDEPLAPNGLHVLVIGAGMAGLAAAIELKKLGYTVSIVESQNQVGGRIKTNRTLPFPFDEGASWIHGPRKNPLDKIAQDAGAKRFVTSDENVVVYQSNGEAYSDNVLETEENKYNELLDRISAKAGGDANFLDALMAENPNLLSDPLWNYFLSAYLEFDTGGDVSELSAKYFYDDAEFSGADEFITNGYSTLSDFLAKDLDITLGAKVSKINLGKGVSIETSSGETFMADYAVITVPLGVLQKEKIAFEPPLPSLKQGAIQRLGMGVVNKFLMIWDEAFWDTQRQYIGFAPEKKGGLNYFLNLKTFSQTNGLVCFSYGKQAAEIEALDDEQSLDLILSHLTAIYGTGLARPHTFVATRWGQNEHSFGSYSFVKAGAQSNDYNLLAEPVANTLFFAGEHCSRNYRGTVHGAYLSGVEAAKAIFKVKPQ